MTGSSHPVRILGLETEYGVVTAHTSPVDGAASPPLSPAEAIAELFRGTRQQDHARNRYLPNGGRLYVDLGSHPEYATAECTLPRDVAVQDRAGEELLRRLAATANERLNERGIRIHIVKTNTDRGGATFGCHENYQIRRETLDSLDPGFIAFLATRPILTGSGGISENGEFVLSSRAAHIRSVVTADPTKARPFIVTREEPHADATRFARLQVTYGDSNVCDATTELKLTITSAVLDLLERGGSPRDLALADPVAALHETARLGAEARLPLADGRSMTSLDLQEAVLERCQEQGSAVALDGAREITDALRANDLARVAPRLDWACKEGMLRQAAARRDLPLNSPLIARIELAYHDIDSERGLAGRLRTGGQMASVVGAREIERACSEPPADTRAAVRGRFVAEADRLGLMASVSWTHVRLDSPPRPQIDLIDASASADTRVDALIDEIRAMPRPTMSALRRLQAGLGPLNP